LRLLPLAGLLVVVLSPGRAAPSVVQELRTQKVGDVTYFHVRLEMPRDLVQDADRFDRGWFAQPAPSLAPRLIAPDGQVRLVCQRFDPNRRNRFGPAAGRVEEMAVVSPPPAKDKGKTEEKMLGGPRQSVPVTGLEFVGRKEAKGEVKMKLVYPVQGRRPRLLGRLSRTPPAPVWKEMEVVLDFGKARNVPVPAEAAGRRKLAEGGGPLTPRRVEPAPPAVPGPAGGEALRPPVRDDLEGLWAVAQVHQFIDLDNEVVGFGYYGFAASATARKYGVRASISRWDWRLAGVFPDRGPAGRGGFFDQELYETTTGAAAITESLQLRRMNAVGARGDDKRTIPVAKLRGIDIAEHPWEKMMGERKPAPESFAQMVPHDNYYVHFKRIARFLEFSELLDQWGTNITRAYEVTSRDHRLKERYQQQLCLRSTALGKTLGPLIIKGVALTGNDAYLREGSDLAVLFEVSRRKLFLSAVQPFIAEARKKFGDRLKESKLKYHDVEIESFVTPLREVSQHRASLGDFVVYANSPIGIRRIIDTHQGRGKRLADSLDFQYMRTIFRYDDKEEDGFAFLSDAFIRNLVGPVSKIKERRRLEALVSLHMLTHGAMYTAWESGKDPISSVNLMQVSGLKREELPMPEGKPAFWDSDHQRAISDVYNTIHFATPLVELPIDDVTRTEAAEYERFRLEYLGLWRQFFDPIGMRLSMKEGGQVKLDTYILPLIENTRYNKLRRVTGQKTVRFDPASLSSKTLMQYMIRLNSNLEDRQGWLGWFGGPSRRGEFHPLSLLAWAMDPVGEWILIRFDDSPVYEKLLALAMRAEEGKDVDIEEVARQVWSLPVAIGVDVRNPLVFAGTLVTIRTSAQNALPGALTWAPLEKPYKGVSIVRVQATRTGREMMGPLVGGRRRSKDPFRPALYYAMIDGGFYLTLNEEMMHSLIDGASAKRDGKGGVEVATSLYLSPATAEQTKSLLRRLLEQQIHHQARAALPIWYALYRTGIVPEAATSEQAREAAYRYLGFVPVSPDGTGFRYDRTYDEVVNERHGSFRKPSLHRTTAETSPLNFLLDQLRSIRADLRFREDGIHTVLTMDRSKGGK
jgi:hypothetical protein